jgi:hypothetical protein
VSANAVLGIHCAHFTRDNGAAYNSAEFERAGRNAHFHDKRYAMRLAKVSNQSVTYWLEEMAKAGTGLNYIWAGELVDKYAMAEWYRA